MPLVESIHSYERTRVTLNSVQDVPGAAASVFATLKGFGIEVDKIIQGRSSMGTSDISFICFGGGPMFSRAMKSMAKKIKFRGFTTDNDIEVIEISGPVVGGFDRKKAVLAMYNALAQEGINTKGITSNDRGITILVDKQNKSTAFQALHKAYGL